MKVKRTINYGLEKSIAVNRANNNLLDTIKMYVPDIVFTKIGKVYQAKCPFKKQKDTRFYVWPEKQCWFTYDDMNLQGDIVSFVSELKEVNADDAVNDIVEKIGDEADKTISIPLYSANQDFLFFKNVGVRITGSLMELIPLELINPDPQSDYIIDHDFEFESNNLFEIKYSESYLTTIDDNNLDPLDIFTLKCNWGNLSYAQFLYNTSNIYWKQQQEGKTLTESQEKEIAFDFINKVCALGYACRKYKDRSKAYMLMAVEDTRNINSGTNAGIGKSLFYLPLKYVRHLSYQDGHFTRSDRSDLIYSEVVSEKTDVVLFDDLSEYFPINLFFNGITGNMSIRKPFEGSKNIPFEESPILISTSNNLPKRLDKSALRRLWFCNFSDYYHISYENGVEQSRKPNIEFGKNIILDYSEEEMNKMYFFIIQCIQSYILINDITRSMHINVQSL